MWTLWLLLLAAGGRLERFDLSIIHAVQGRENAAMTAAAERFTAIGSSKVVIPLVLGTAVLLFFLLKHRRELALLTGGMLGSTLLNELLKRIYHRARPDIHRIVAETGYSYPSGHAMASLTFYGLLVYLLWRHLSSRGWRLVLLAFSFCMIACIGLSRIYLGVHYPSDVLGGYWASGCWMAFCILLYRRYERGRLGGGRRKAKSIIFTSGS
ncbi:phosphatase PAP2 family protein [Paenibacillus humicola]|uniref:phosphatase PAP2 family protein n=1 Tax=Paenibacillus humicola TaxID=3110540 RepID=UPI00237A3EF3|nr:phosphatase PAP2 family protein [Paenibacillus humicola]